MRVLLAILFTVILSGGAVAQSCSSLRAQLASAQSKSGGANMAGLRRQHKAYGCHLSKGWGRNRACAGIEAKMARGGGRDSRRVRQLRRQVSRACSQRQRGERRAQPAQQRRKTRNLANTSRILSVSPSRNSGSRQRSGGNIFSNLFGSVARDEVEVVDPRRRDRYNGRVERVNLDVDREPRKKRSSSSGGSDRTYTMATGRGKRSALRYGSSRTVCVRLCDGFYFPINNHSHSDNFYDELAMCVGRCPGADVSLYVHNNQSPVEGMRSTMTGEAYVNLPTAFVYRRKAVSDCSCRARTVVAGDLSADKALRAAGLGGDEPDTAPGAGETAADKDTAATPTTLAWRRFKAVYDETGKPLKLFPKLGRERGAPKSEDEPSEKRSLTPLPSRGAPKGPSLPLAMVQATGDEAVRTIGSRDYTDTIAASQSAERDRDLRPRAPVRSTAVTVVPLDEIDTPVVGDDRRAGIGVTAPAPEDPDQTAAVSLDGAAGATLFAASNPAQ